MAIRPESAQKIASAKTSGGGNNINDGEYVMVVKRILCEAKYKGTFLIPEFDVLEAAKNHPSVEPNRVGSDCSCAWQIDGNGPAGDAARGNAKQFLVALLNLPADMSEADVMAKASSYAGAAGDPDALKARGMIVHVKTHRKVTKGGPNAGKEGVYPRFNSIEQADAEIAKRRADLDAQKR